MLFHLKTLKPLKVVFFRGLEVWVLKFSAYLDDYVLSTDDSDENLTYREAIKSSLKSKWIEATRKEYNALIEIKTWVLSPLPPGRKALEADKFAK